MKIKLGMEQEYQAFQKANGTDGYGRAVAQYVERWADLMEKELEAGAALPDIAERTGRQANTELLSGFQYDCAVHALSRFWLHGEELRQWHNQQYSYDGPGTVNLSANTIMM